MLDYTFSRIKYCLTLFLLFQQFFPTMEILNLSHSHGITETPWLFICNYNLEVLILKDCPNLVGVHESTGTLEKLVELNMEDCKNDRKLPDISWLKFIEILVISGCSNLNEFPMDMRNMKSLKVCQAYGVSVHKLLHTIANSEIELGQQNNPEMFWTSHLPCNLVDLVSLPRVAGSSLRFWRPSAKFITEPFLKIVFKRK